MKKLFLYIFYIVLFVTIIGIPIVLLINKRKKDYGKTSNVLKPSIEVQDKKFEDEKRTFSPLYMETTVLPIITEEDIKKYEEEAIKGEKTEVNGVPRKDVKKKSNRKKKKGTLKKSVSITKKSVPSKNKSYNKVNNKKKTYNGNKSINKKNNKSSK